MGRAFDQDGDLQGQPDPVWFVFARDGSRADRPISPFFFPQTLDTIFRSFPRTLPATLLVSILPLTVSHLTKLLPFHTLYSLSSTSDISPPPPTDAAVAADGDDITIEQVVCPIVDFLTEVTRAGKLAKGWTEGKGGETESMALKEVVGAVLGFTMMTTEEEDEWANDPNAFVMEEDDETDLYSIRVAGHDFISVSPTDSA